MTDLDAIIGRLATGEVPHRAVMGDVGRQVYLNDPDGDSMIGHNVELVEYASEVRRSGLPGKVA